MAIFILIFVTLLISNIAVYCDESKELKVEVTSVAIENCTRKTKKHDLVTMHYTGFLSNGSKFDSSWERNQPFQFQLGIGQVIRGWEEGLLDMCPGEKRKLTIPPNYAYGDKGAGEAIPPNETLTFDVELVHTAEGPVPPNVFKAIDKDKNQKLTYDEVSYYLIEQSSLRGQKVDKDSPDHKKIVQTILDHEDKNKDGVISLDEFSGPKHDEL